MMCSSNCLSDGGQVERYTRDVSPGSGEQASSPANFFSAGHPVHQVPAASAQGACCFYLPGQQLLPEQTDCSRLIPAQPHQEDSRTYNENLTVGQSDCLEVRLNTWDHHAPLTGQESGCFSLKHHSEEGIQVSPYSLLTPAASVVWSSPDFTTSQTASQVSESYWAPVPLFAPSAVDSHPSAYPDVLLSSYQTKIEPQLDYSTASDIGNFSSSSTPMLRTTSSTPLPASVTSNNSSRLGTHDTDEAAMKTLPGGASISSCGGDASPAETPYAQLIYRALMSREDRCMSLQEIYQWFREHTNKTDGRGKGWQNSIRHNLSMNQGFVKYDQKEGTNPSHNNYTSVSTRRNDKQKRSTVWTLQDWAVQNGIQSTTRYRDARRRGETRHRSAASQSRLSSSSALHRDGHQNTGNTFGTGRMSILGSGLQRHFPSAARPTQTSHFNTRQTPIVEPNTPRSHSQTFFQDPYFSQHSMGAQSGMPQSQQTTTDISGQPCGMMVPPSMIQRQLSNSPSTGMHYQLHSTGDRNQSMFLNSQYRSQFPYRPSDVQLGFSPTRNRNSQPRSPGGFIEGQYPDGIYNWNESH
ncbi:hypothetical protein V2G26_011564 [Clonostachys chloroleuca]